MKTVVIPDLHVPFQHPEHTKALLRFIKKERPDGIVLLGDVLDLHSITTHRQVKNFQDKLDEEIYAGCDFLSALRKAAGPKASITYIKGNHEDRWDRAIQSQVPAFRMLDMSLPKYLDLESMDIRWVEDASVTPIRVPCGQGQKVRFIHGHEVKGSSRTPGGHALKVARLLGENIHCGHTHRLGLLMAPRTSKGRQVDLFGIEGGLLANKRSPALRYAGPAPEWVYSWSVYDSKDNSSPYPKFYRPV